MDASQQDGRGAPDSVTVATIPQRELRCGDVVVAEYGDLQRVEALRDSEAYLWSVTYRQTVGWRRRDGFGTVQVVWPRAVAR